MSAGTRPPRSAQERLFNAVRLGRHASILKQLRFGAVIDARDALDIMEKTALCSAVEKRRRDVVQLLLDHGADPNASGRASTPLMMAVEVRSTGLVQLLLEHGADTEARNCLGQRVDDLLAQRPPGPTEEKIRQLLAAARARRTIAAVLAHAALPTGG